MGCLLSCCLGSDSDSQAGEEGERARLLPPPVTWPRPASPGQPGRTRSPPATTDSQAALNTILHQTAATIIDIGALESGEGLDRADPGEEQDRAALYGLRLAGAGPRLAQQQQLVGPISPSQQDTQLVTTVAALVGETLASIQQLDCSEDIVVAFGEQL